MLAEKNIYLEFKSILYKLMLWIRLKKKQYGLQHNNQSEV